jgi:hypothetical protein
MLRTRVLEKPISPGTSAVCDTFLTNTKLIGGMRIFLMRQ